MIFAAILAGGIGSRMGGTDTPKQFLTLGDKPVIIHTIEKFVINSKFDKILVLSPPNFINVILERDWHSNHRDIDIIAQQGDCIVFVEVKTRRNREYGDPLQAINYQKQKNLRRAINHYIHFRHLNNPWRFDVITIVGVLGCNMPEISHIEDFALR